MRESISEFMDRQNRKVARFGREAEAAAHEAYRKSIRLGEDLKLGSPGDVMRHGAQLLQDAEDRAVRAVSRKAEGAKARARAALRGVAQNPVARSVAIDTARTAGNVAGVVRGGVHAVEGLVDGATFLGRLVDPLDRLKSAPGQSAVEQLGRGVVNTGRMGVDYVRKGVADPQGVVTDVTNAAGQWRRELDPSATPVAPTLEGELRRNFDIGQNQGELAFDVGSLVMGGPAAKAVKGLSRVASIGNDAKYLAQGFGPKAAAYLAEPYPASGMGSHYVPRRARLPEILGGGPLPKSYMDGPFNRLAPPGISRGDMYELHYQVDPRFNVARLPREVGGGVWQGGKIDLERYDQLGRLWHGAPPPLKARVGGLGAGAGGALYSPEEESDW
ncbi:MAG: hypothetical protein JNL41_06790 [Phenylobacterium sp.]|uniref:hypothetical protein n=1 Tax=Phenylobacterium sp. TaxID=1871053 RepID=UPI001A56B61C|nr:hypothetical protein [Phenylobacterium sp.]MBL8553968.1 hypothetical protein [Phenylobacterium sp.]